ncbi:aminotransferase class V-fold PLP-dependent enzyme [uncultured Tenacibaculum sp.]|uniref:pyridoxal phosphate-dependent decarboxylase family protein n=1 Tax=uncultured Tenacibaculum sp. TaxID=174713 RepID=UPI00261D1D1A|nr:aminotransferase class V-fold PLP-dependent enzyme [uncultured Tenacibaculum sp.]
MKSNNNLEDINGLDPENWEEMRELGHQMIDDMISFLKKIHLEPSWKEIPKDTKAYFKEDLPVEPQNSKKVYQDFKRYILPYHKGNIHPRFFAWVQGSGTLMGAYSEMLAAVMNPNVTIGEHAAMYVDEQVVKWCKQMLNYPNSSSGILLSGGSMANITGLTVARNAHSNLIREHGIQKNSKKLVVYCSEETHSCITKAAEIIGIGNKFVRKIKTNSEYEMDCDKLLEQLLLDIKEGLQPFCIVATTGTVNTGAIDPLEDIYNICKKYNLWLHIDGAYGALAKLDPNIAPKLKYIELADSVAFDLHKWLHVPYELGCLLVKDADTHRSTFAITPNYLLQTGRGLAGGLDAINNYGFELSRSFKALKVWMSLKETGIKKHAQLISKNNEQAKYLESKILKSNELEILAPVTMSIVCFRYFNKKLSMEKINKLNEEIIIQLQEKGIASPSSTILNDKYCIRVCIVNHKTKKEDLDFLISGVIQLGSEILKNNF